MYLCMYILERYKRMCIQVNLKDYENFKKVNRDPEKLPEQDKDRV